MQKSSQNEAIGKDPVFLNKPDTILPQLYLGGRSAVGDASKFFYQFPTAPGDRPYLGVRWGPPPDHRAPLLLPRAAHGLGQLPSCSRTYGFRIHPADARTCPGNLPRRMQVKHLA